MVDTGWADARHLSADALGRFIPVPFRLARRGHVLPDAGTRFLRVSARYLGLPEPRP